MTKYNGFVRDCYTASHSQDVASGGAGAQNGVIFRLSRLDTSTSDGLGTPEPTGGTGVFTVQCSYGQFILPNGALVSSFTVPTFRQQRSGSTAEPGTLRAPWQVLSLGNVVEGNQHAVTSGEAAAGTLSITTGLSVIKVPIVQILRTGKVATSDAAVSFTGTSITVANGSTYTLTAGDVISWIAALSHPARRISGL